MNKYFDFEKYLPLTDNITNVKYNFDLYGAYSTNITYEKMMNVVSNNLPNILDLVKLPCEMIGIKKINYELYSLCGPFIIHKKKHNDEMNMCDFILDVEINNINVSTLHLYCECNMLDNTYANDCVTDYTIDNMNFYNPLCVYICPYENKLGNKLYLQYLNYIISHSELSVYFYDICDNIIDTLTYSPLKVESDDKIYIFLDRTSKYHTYILYKHIPQKKYPKNIRNM